MAKYFIFFLGLTVLTFASANPWTSKNLKIVGGVETTIEDVPYQLQMERFILDARWAYTCGAVIIGKEWVLTAGHCAEGSEIEDMRFFSGETIRGNGTVHTIESLVIHPNFTNNGAWGDNDVAVVKVTPAFEFSNTTQPIELIQEQPATGAEGLVSGWGVLSSGSGTLPRVLMKVSVPISDQEVCAQMYGEAEVALTETMLCAGDLAGGQGPCTGDSGGPLAVGGKLAGLVSFGYGCAEPGFPTIFTNIQKFVPWILEQMKA